jgi:hypothetical protein
MGDRVSIQFVKGNEKSVVLFCHWGGMEFVGEAQQYVDELKAERKDGVVRMPLDRLEPNTVMVDFIRYITKDLDRVDSNYYLAVDENHGDNSDNGHHVIEL